MTFKYFVESTQKSKSIDALHKQRREMCICTMYVFKCAHCPETCDKSNKQKNIIVGRSVAFCFCLAFIWLSENRSVFLSCKERKFMLWIYILPPKLLLFLLAHRCCHHHYWHCHTWYRTLSFCIHSHIYTLFPHFFLFIPNRIEMKSSAFCQYLLQ